MYRAFDPEYLYPVDYEPAYYEREEIVWPGSDQEDNLSVEERARKKRRIEEKGLEYLLGAAPFILTATLRGPFENGWRNPWAKKKDGDELGDLGVRQDEIKLSSEEPPSALPPAPADVEHVPNKDDGPQDTADPHIAARRSPKYERNKSYELVPLLPTSIQASRSSPIRNSDWLKRDDGRRTIANRRQSVSPTTRLKTHDSPQKRNSPSVARQKRMSQMEHEKAFKIIKISDWDSQMERSMPKQNHSKGTASRKPHKHDQVKTVSMSRHNVLKQRSPKPIRLEEHLSKVTAEGDKESMKPAPRKRYVHRERTVAKESLSHMSHVDDSFKAERRRSSQSKPDQVSHDESSKEVPKKYVSATSGSSRAHSSSDERVPDVVEGGMLAQGHSHRGSPNGDGRERSMPIASECLPSTQTRSQVRDSRPTSRSANDKSNDKNEGENQPKPQQDAQTTKTSSVMSRKALSKESSNLPEAQPKDIPPPLPTTLTRSSTNLLETEKQLPTPIFGDGDSYLNWSTQAAIEKVGRKLQEDVLTSFAHPPAPSDVRKINNTSETSRQVPTSKQAMADEVSPFDMPITEKQPGEGLRTRGSSRRRLFQQRSPSDSNPAPLRSYSPNMSTSVSRSNSYDQSQSSSSQAGEPTHPERSPPSFYMSASSKPSAITSSHAHPPPSTDNDVLTSFSIQPDGTLIETRIYQDGQQRDPFPIPEEFTSLPSFSISSKPPTSSAPYNKFSFVTTTNNHNNNHRSTQRSSPYQLPLQLSAEYHSQSQPLPHPSTKYKPEGRPAFGSGSQRPPSSQHNQHQHNHRYSQPSQSQSQSRPLYRLDGFSIPPASAPALADKEDGVGGVGVSESQNTNTQDREAEKFIEDAGAGDLLGDGEWDLEREVRRMGRDGRNGDGVRDKKRREREVL